MRTIVEQVLDHARFGARNVELELSVCDLGEIVRGEVDALQRRSDQALVRMLLPSTPVWATVDRVRVAQIVSNLLDNAVKYGGRPPEVDVRLGTEGDLATIRVRDNGAGVPPEERDVIFEQFRQGANAQGGGLGVGLWLANQFAELMGGGVALASSMPTEFAVTLPSSAPKERIAGKPLSAEPSPEARG
jgi:signal transduction histidine kinase